MVKNREMVPTEGFEPPHLSTHGPEPCASTNSATWAYPERMFLPSVDFSVQSFGRKITILAGLLAKSIALRFPVKSANMARAVFFRYGCPYRLFLSCYLLAQPVF